MLPIQLAFTTRLNPPRMAWLISGIPTLMYGIAAIFLIRYTESLAIDGYEKPIPIYFLYKEDKGAQF